MHCAGKNNPTLYASKDHITLPKKSKNANKCNNNYDKETPIKEKFIKNMSREFD
jgi:hypothetical protein